MDEFEVLQTLGRGSFGVVRKVRRKADGKTLVEKEMNYGAANEKQKEQIVAEVNILRELRHPFIVRYYDRVVERRQTRIHIIMEYCKTDLARVIGARRIRGEYLEEAFLWNLFSQVAMALDYCHGRLGKEGSRMPIVHRDLKPENVFLSEDNVVKLGDFGLAKELRGAQLAKTTVGTPYYMSPELINDERYDERTDVWSLGCLMYEATALSRPFEAHNQVALAMKINTGKVPPIPSKYSPDLFVAIEWMLSKALHKRPFVRDVLKIPRLKLPLRENRVIVKEFQLQQSYAQRLRDLESRESDVAKREAKLADSEAALQRRAEALALLLEEEKRKACSPGLSPVNNASPSPSKHVAFAPRESELPRPRPPSSPYQQPGSRLRRWQQAGSGSSWVELDEAGGRSASPRGGEEGAGVSRVVGGERASGEGGGGGGSVPMGGGGRAEKTIVSQRYKESEPRQNQNVAEATTAVLEYASLVLHQRPTSETHSSQLDDTILLGAHGGAIAAAAGVAPRGYRRPRPRESAARGGVVTPERRTLVWEADELFSHKAEAVAAAGRKARESYAGFRETIAAGGRRGSGAGKENRHPRSTVAHPRPTPPAAASLAEVAEASGGRYRSTNSSCRLDPKDDARVYMSRRAHDRRRPYQRSVSDVSARDYSRRAQVLAPVGGLAMVMEAPPPRSRRGVISRF